MKTMSVTDFKAHFLELVGQIAMTGESFVLTKRGKPVAMVVPPPTEPKKFVLGQFRDQGRIVGDIVSPLDEPWEALS